MTKLLRRRRALLDELRRIDAELTPDAMAADAGSAAQWQAFAGEQGLFESLIANAPDLVLLVDQDHRIEFANRIDPPRTREQVIGVRAGDLVAAEDRQRVTDAIEQVFTTGMATAYETRVETGASERWYAVRVGPVLQAGRVSRVSLVSTEVTEQRRQAQLQAEQQAALRQSEQRFRTLVEFAPEAVVIFDLATGRFVDVNANACRLFDMTREQLLESGVADVSPEHQPDGSPSVPLAGEWNQRAVSGEHPVFEWYHSTRDGTLIPCEVRLVRLPHSNRHWVRGSIIDISERKQADEERARLTTELAQAQKLQAIGQLTGGVAHDFNNLLTVIMSSLEMIELRPGSADDVLAHTRQALAASERAAALTRQLLAFARRQPLRPRQVNLGELVRATESLLRRTLGAGVTIETRTGDDLWPCELDSAQLENAILNLAINARDAMPHGGRLTIETANVSLGNGEASRLAALGPGDYVRLAVIDSGVGMSPEVVRHAFEPFFTTKDTGRGSGLGLSMVYGFVRQSGGHVQIASQPGHGTTVEIHLPRARGDDTEQLRRPAAVMPPLGRGEALLVVEDEPAVRSLVVRHLQGLGYQVRQAGDVASALASLAEPPPAALVLTDVLLPGGHTGSDLALAIAERWPGLPVLYMSGYSMMSSEVPGGHLDHGHPLLEKPFTRHQLALAVRNVLDQQGEAQGDAGGIAQDDTGSHARD